MISNLLNTPHICLSLIEIWKFFSKKKKERWKLFFIFLGESFDNLIVPTGERGFDPWMPLLETLGGAN